MQIDFNFGHLKIKICNEQAYICHRNNHWFAYRKIGDIWYDLNSLLSYPQQIKVEATQLAKPIHLLSQSS